MPYFTIRKVAAKETTRFARVASILLVTTCVVSVTAAVAWGLALRPAPPEPPSLAQTRQVIQQLAGTESDHEFVAKFYALVAKYHVMPISRKGNRLPIAAGAQLVLNPEGKVALRSVSGELKQLGQQDFLRGVNARGQWVTPDDDALGSLDALVVRSEQLLIMIDLNQSAVGFARCTPKPAKVGADAGQPL